jgi:peptidoglycan hydrolase-like protein with peptidoglycan-binding domain
VPSSKLGTTSYVSAATGGQTIRVTMREELVPLWNLAFEIIDKKFHYPSWASRGGQAWGPWGYENRAISGTSRPSGHSAGLSVDINAPYNPYSRTFQSDMPPAMVAALESLGLYWGGRYQGQKYDPMHWGYCRTPAAVAGFITRAKSILGSSGSIPAPTPSPAPAAGGTFPLASGKFYGTDGVTSGAGVVAIQKKVGATADGAFGPATKAKVVAWQTAHALTPDGRVGPMTWDKMF